MVVIGPKMVSMPLRNPAKPTMFSIWPGMKSCWVM